MSTKNVSETEKQRNCVKNNIFGVKGDLNNPRHVLETAGGWIGANFAGASEEQLTQFMDYFADHVIAGRPLGQSVEDLIDDLIWGDLDEVLLDDAAERAAQDLAGDVRSRRLG